MTSDVLPAKRKQGTSMPMWITPRAVQAIGFTGWLLAGLAAGAGWIGWPEASLAGGGFCVLGSWLVADRVPRGPRSPGSRTFLDRLTTGRSADRHGEPGRYVYRCYLRGDAPHFPARWRPGWLYLAGGMLVWREDWHRTEQVITRPLIVRETPLHDQDLAALRAGRFQLMAVKSAAGSTLYLAVASPDIAQLPSLLQSA